MGLGFMMIFPILKQKIISKPAKNLLDFHCFFIEKIGLLQGRLFKESKTQMHPSISVVTDSGYQGLQKIHARTQMPKKRSKKSPLTNEDKENNRQLSRERVLNENVIGSLKRFKIIADRYRNRRKRFCLRFNLIAGIYNLELV